MLLVAQLKEIEMDLDGKGFVKKYEIFNLFDRFC
jgi:hypothetical protein